MDFNKNSQVLSEEILNTFEHQFKFTQHFYYSIKIIFLYTKLLLSLRALYVN